MQVSQAIVLVAVGLIASAPIAAQNNNLRLPISLDADSSHYDGKSTMVMFRGLRLTQGSIGIEADEAHASKLDFEESIWQLSGNVIIDVQNGHIECDAADLTFSNYQLILATIKGSPATFEMQRPNSPEPTYAEAGRLEYDLGKGIIQFSEQATITENGNRISSNYLVYNIKEQLINAQSGGSGDPKVRITYTPKEATPAEIADDQSESNTADTEGSGDGGP